MTTVVMTGATSGFGALTGERLADSEDVRLIVGARRSTSVGEWIPLDLSALASVRSFADEVRELLGDSHVDALVLNAGLIRSDVTERTTDGFETTFAVNHLAHYLLLRLLAPHLADDGVVILTTSGAHDPDVGAGLTPPRHASAELLAYPDRDPDCDAATGNAGQHAYTASKLCTVLTARSFGASSEARGRRLTTIAYDPGQVFGTSLARDLPVPMRLAWSLLGTPVGWPLRRLNRTLNTSADAGRTLAELALGVITPPTGRQYAALRGGRLTWTDPSESARDDDLARALWSDSAALVGLPD